MTSQASVSTSARWEQCQRSSSPGRPELSRGASAPAPAPMAVLEGKVGAAPVCLSVQKSLIINTAVGGIALSSVSPEWLERAGEVGASGELCGVLGRRRLQHGVPACGCGTLGLQL